jgi:hypothetical protein
VAGGLAQPAGEERRAVPAVVALTVVGHGRSRELDTATDPEATVNPAEALRRERSG